MAAKNIINLILVLNIYDVHDVQEKTPESSFVLLEEGVFYDHAFSWQNSLPRELAFALLYSVLQGQIRLLLQVSLDFLL